MRFLLDRDALRMGLAAVGGAVSHRHTLPPLQGVLVEASADEGLSLTATNLEIGIVCRLQAEVVGEGATVVPARLLSQFVGSLPAGPITAELDSPSETLRLGCGHMKARIKCIAADEFPILAMPDEGKALAIDARLLREMIGQVAYAAAPDDSRPVLHGVLVEVSPAGITMAAADGYRLAKRSASVEPAPDWEGSAIIPASAMREVASALKGVEGAARIIFSQEQARVAFSMGGLRIMSQLVEGTFPEYQQIIPTSHKTRARLGAAALVHAVRAASLFAPVVDRTIRRVNLAFDASKVRVSASAHAGANESELDCILEGEPIEVAMNPSYMAETLDSVPTEEVVIDLIAPASPVVVSPNDETDLVVVVMPQILGG